MFFERYLEQDAIAVHSYEDACALMKILVENGNCVMISREEDLWLVNWVWGEGRADRNDVIFADRGVYECNLWNWQKQHPEIKYEDKEDEE